MSGPGQATAVAPAPELEASATPGGGGAESGVNTSPAAAAEGLQEVGKIIAKRVRIEYLVQWRGETLETSTWEPAYKINTTLLRKLAEHAVDVPEIDVTLDEAAAWEAASLVRSVAGDVAGASRRPDDHPKRVREAAREAAAAEDDARGYEQVAARAAVRALKAVAPVHAKKSKQSGAGNGTSSGTESRKRTADSDGEPGAKRQKVASGTAAAAESGNVMPDVSPVMTIKVSDNSGHLAEVSVRRDGRMADLKRAVAAEMQQRWAISDSVARIVTARGDPLTAEDAPLGSLLGDGETIFVAWSSLVSFVTKVKGFDKAVELIVSEAVKRELETLNEDELSAFVSKQMEMMRASQTGDGQA